MNLTLSKKGTHTWIQPNTYGPIGRDSWLDSVNLFFFPLFTFFRSVVQQVHQTHEKSLTSAWTRISPQIWQLTLPSHLPVLLSLWHTHRGRNTHPSQFSSHLNAHMHRKVRSFSLHFSHFLNYTHTCTHACVHRGAQLWEETVRGKRRW